MSERRYDKYVKRCLTLDEYIVDAIGGLPNEAMLTEQWQKMPVCQIGYDSEAETLKHIKRVNELLINAVVELLNRAKKHDDSKLKSPEKELFDEFTPKLKNVVYGSEEYKEMLKELDLAIRHHYENNSHHPQYYEGGIDDMCLFDVIEMFLDWKAAGERDSGGNIFKSIEINAERFNLSPQLVSIFKNTAKKL